MTQIHFTWSLFATALNTNTCLCSLLIQYQTIEISTEKNTSVGNNQKIKTRRQKVMSLLFFLHSLGRGFGMAHWVLFCYHWQLSPIMDNHLPLNWKEIWPRCNWSDFCCVPGGINRNFTHFCFPSDIFWYATIEH